MFDPAHRSRPAPYGSLRDARGDATLGWGLVGASAMAARAVDAIRAQPPLADAGGRAPVTNGQIVGIFSHSEHRARQFADTQAVAHSFVNLADLLAHPDIQCVYVGNHPRHHAQVVLAALAAGKHVFCEPPLALDVVEAQRVAHTALSRSLVLAVNFPRRADAAVRALRDLIREGSIGDVLGGRASNTALLRPAQQTWRLRTPGGGAVLDRTAQTVDVLRYLLRDEAGAIHSLGTHQILGTSVEENVLSHLTLRRSQLVFQIHDSFIVPHTPSSIEIDGTTGTLMARHCFVDDLPSQLFLARHGQIQPVPLAASHPMRAAIQSFMSAVRTRGAPLATGSDGVQSLAVALAAQESMRRGHAIVLDLPDRPLVDRAIF